MRFLSTKSGFLSVAVLAIVSIGGPAKMVRSEQMGRFVHVSALIDGQNNVDGVSLVASMAFGGDRVYLSSQLDNCLTLLSRSEDGSLKVVEHIVREAFGDVPAGAKKIPTEQAARVGGGTARLTKDHSFLFLASGHSILLFERGDDGQLTLRTTHGDPVEVIHGAGYLTFEISPDERFLFTNRLRDEMIEVIAFDRDAKSMTRVQEVSGLRRCEALAMSPDGRHLYTVSPTNELVYVFGIDAESGKLTKLREMTARDCGLGTLKNARAVEMSPDGSFLVVTSVRRTGEVSVLKRDSDSGNLTPVQHLTDMEIGNRDLNYPVCAALTTDGKTLFLGCETSQCVVVLRKDEGADKFSYLETIKHPTIELPTCLEVDGKFLFVCSRNTGIVSVFRINEEKDQQKEQAER